MKQYVLVYTLGLIALSAAGSGRADDQYTGLRSPYSDWSVFAEADHTDNVTLASSAVADTIETAGVRGGLYRDTGRLIADIAGTLRYEQFQNHTFDSDTRGQFVGTVSYAIIPGRFKWIVQDTYGQVVGDVYAPPTPQNRVNANYLMTGPDANVSIGSGFDLLAGARFAAADFANSSYGNVVNDQSLSAHVGLRERLSKSSSVSLNGAYTRIAYQGSQSPTFDRSEVAVAYTSRSERGGGAIELGATQVKSDQSLVGSQTSPLARLMFFRRLTPSWNLNVSGSREFRDNGLGLQSALDASQVLNGQVVPVSAGGSDAVDLLLAQSLSRTDSVRVSFDFVRPRTSIAVSSSFQKDRYPYSATPLDRESWTVGGGINRRVRPLLTAHLRASVTNRAPEGALPGDRTTQEDAGLDWQVGRLMLVTLGYEHANRATDVGGASYQYNRIALHVSYGVPEHHLKFQQAAPSESVSMTR